MPKRRTRRFSENDVLRLLRFTRAVPIAGTFHERFEELARELRTLLPFKTVAAFVLDPSSRTSPPPSRRYHSAGRSETNVEYASSYMAWDPTAPLALSAPPGAIILSDHVPARQFGRDPYTGEFLPREGVRWIGALAAELPWGQRLAVGFHREGRQGDFTPDERRLLELVREDLLRSAAGALLAEALAGRPEPSASSGNDGGVRRTRARSGVLVLGDDGAPVASDEGAMQLVARLAEPASFERVLHEGARRVVDPRRTATTITVTTTDGELLRAELVALGSERRVAVFLTTIAAGSPEFQELTLEAARLTGRERAVARLAVGGLGNREIGRIMGCAGGTVKRHLDRVYRKLRVRGRTGLAWLLLGRESPRDGQ